MLVLVWAVEPIHNQMPTKTDRPHPSSDRTNLKEFLRNLTIGNRPMVVDDEYITGRLTAKVKSRITKRLNKAIADEGLFKIGKTGDVWVRTDQNDYRSEYRRFHLIFKSSSQAVIDRLEVEYIRKYLRIQPDRCQNNTVHMVGNMFSYDGFYWLYVVTE